jgi:hypothetical protein
MAESTTIVCDRCKTQVGKGSRTRIRWSVQPEKREPTDLCPSCRDSLLEHYGMLPPTLGPLFGDQADPPALARPKPPVTDGGNSVSSVLPNPPSDAETQYSPRYRDPVGSASDPSDGPTISTLPPLSRSATPRAARPSPPRVQTGRGMQLIRSSVLFSLEEYGTLILSELVERAESIGTEHAVRSMLDDLIREGVIITKPVLKDGKPARGYALAEGPAKQPPPARPASTSKRQPRRPLVAREPR